mgnify:CR=1 FL=1
MKNKFLRENINVLTDTSDLVIQGKMDGAPAIICGTDPVDGKFFVGTKSVFSKTEPKLCKSNRHYACFTSLGCTT